MEALGPEFGSGLPESLTISEPRRINVEPYDPEIIAAVGERGIRAHVTLVMGKPYLVRFSRVTEVPISFSVDRRISSKLEIEGFRLDQVRPAIVSKFVRGGQFGQLQKVNLYLELDKELGPIIAASTEELLTNIGFRYLEYLKSEPETEERDYQNGRFDISILRRAVHSLIPNVNEGIETIPVAEMWRENDEGQRQEVVYIPDSNFVLVRGKGPMVMEETERRSLPVKALKEILEVV